MRDEPSQHSRALPSTRAGSTSWRGHALRVACWHGVCESTECASTNNTTALGDKHELGQHLTRR
jgi:hypothetical protein